MVAARQDARRHGLRVATRPWSTGSVRRQATLTCASSIPSAALMVGMHAVQTTSTIPVRAK